VKYEFFALDISERIAIVKIERPKSLNALSIAVLEELDSIVEYMASSGEAAVAIFTGEGKAFAAGADIGEMASLGVEEARNYSTFGSHVFRRLESLEIPTIAAVNGYALGGGCELALACDIRIAGDKAKFGQPETSLGITPGFSGTQRLPRVVGASKAKELIFSGDTVSAEEALRIGLVSRVVAQEELIPTCVELARKIAKNAPRAVAYCKAAIDGGLDAGAECGMALERNLFALCFATADQKEGMRAFLEKRNPSYVGR
jgi:enoyl-CoA hydratase